ncbi:hypothetical protein NW762_008051 [Fusarium torreyae]|uniref:Histidine kinase n=1 Tax=Fusarium torreyae TaxID=1237075 RepID=A0A9W8RYG9_9HYPO|nr:hypothetical protein NW762_008051 [Fusarium torreyae]
MITESHPRRAVPHKLVSEASRETEMFRYWPPLQTGKNVHDFRRPAPSAERFSSADIILTALVQLGTYHVGAERAFLSLFDSEYQYCVAEATSGTYLRSSAPNHIHNQPLELCGTAAPRGKDACNFTLLNQPRDDQDLGDGKDRQTNDGQLPVTVIKDLVEDTSFGTQIILGPRSARFYAAVPIRTRRGINIGVYSIVNTAPREWTEASADRLRDISCAIFDHLEAESLKGANRRNTRINRGIGSFLEGTSTLSGSSLGFNPAAFADAVGATEGNLNRKQQSLQNDSDKTTLGTDEHGSFMRDPVMVQDDHVHMKIPIDHAKQIKETIFENQTLENVFSRAANIIRESLEVEGCFFLDATMAGYRSRKIRTTGTAPSAGQWSSTSSDENTQREADKKLDFDCEINGFSTTTSSSIDRDHPFQGSVALSERFVRRILSRYPHGKIFNFSDTGELQTSDSSGSERTSKRRAEVEEGLRRGTPHETETRLLSRQREGATISAAFPGARSVAFFPIRDLNVERWRASGFIYTNTPVRSFTVEGELSYLKAFGTLAAAEIARLEVSRADKAKSDALGSLSHELRSPLHGVLLSTELIADTKLDVFQSNITHTIETCSRTLLDTIDHLLDYSRVNNFADASNKSVPGNSSKRKHSSTGGTFGGKSLVIDYPLDGLVEEVVESVFAGFNFQHKSINQIVIQKRHQKQEGGSAHADNAANNAADYMDAMDQLSPGVAVVQGSHLEIGPINIALFLDSDCDWLFRFHVGAVRRIVMNIVGNSLKYTRRGTISIFLSQEVASIRRRKSEKVVRLRVEDTGIGIGEAYLQNGIFKAFSQEDDLSPGSGLGLSLVKKIVSQLRGQIQIDSQVNVGTAVNVLLPLERSTLPLSSLQLSVTQQRFNDHVQDLKGLRVRLMSKPGSPAAPSSSSQKALGHTCREWLKLEVLAEDDFSKQPDIVLWTQDALPTEITDIESIAYAPNVVVCPDTVTAHVQSKASEDDNWKGIFEFISQPTGPRKLAKTLSLAYSRWTDYEGPRPSPFGQGVIPLPSAPSRSPSGSSFDQDNKGGSKRVVSEPLPSASPAKNNSGSSGTSQQRLRDLPTGKNMLAPSEPDEARGTPKKFLLVDDNHINLKILSAFMKKLQLVYDTATNGKDAVDKYTQAPGSYACILLDISMPVMNGFEAAKHIRTFENKNGIEHGVPIFALTGLASEEAQREAYGSGFDLFLLKPVRLQALGETLEKQGILNTK